MHIMYTMYFLCIQCIQCISYVHNVSCSDRYILVTIIHLMFVIVVVVRRCLFSFHPGLVFLAISCTFCLSCAAALLILHVADRTVLIELMIFWLFV